MPLLEIRNITKDFGGLRALDGVDLDVHQGEILGIIGPNGAGKSTLYNVISGIYRPRSGRVILDGDDITGLKPHKIAAKGLARTFQVTTLFDNMSVRENMLVGCHLQSGLSLWEIFFNTPKARRTEAGLRNQITDILSFVGMNELQGKTACDFSYGYQRTIGFAVALATNPRLLLLDEPACALNPDRLLDVLNLIQKIHEAGITVVLIEHNMRVIFNLCDRIAVLNYGVKIAEGPPDEIKENKDVIEAYLGKRSAP
ncbi:ABC transporter ATP-binding protein [Chloroflexota bacterium]